MDIHVADPARRILTVSELTLGIRNCLQAGFSDLWVEGEVSNLRAPASGHLYLTLKDSTSQIRAVLFRTGVQRLRFALKEGLSIVVRGRLTVYEPRGEYQMVLEYLEPKGIGALQLALEQLKERLAKEGLFDPDKKRPLPFLPRRIGIVTSLSGAAIRDMLVVLRRRCPIMGVVIAPVPVQGEGAAPLIAQAIRQLSASGLVDVLIVGRGGGSLEDLWSFNEEIVVRAIAASKVPVVSAVGHEIDVTLADFAADHRAPTPSAAAEAVSPVLSDLLQSLDAMSHQMIQSIQGTLDGDRQECLTALRVLRMRPVPLQQAAQRLDEATSQLGDVLHDTLAAFREQLHECRHGLQTCSPVERVRAIAGVLPQLIKRVEQQMWAVLTGKRQAIRAAAGALDTLSPLAVLARGYSIVQTVPGGLVVKRAADVAEGDRVFARLAKGRLLCEIRKIFSDS